jgi:hypothetical protein
VWRAQRSLSWRREAAVVTMERIGLATAMSDVYLLAGHGFRIHKRSSFTWKISCSHNAHSTRFSQSTALIDCYRKTWTLNLSMYSYGRTVPKTSVGDRHSHPTSNHQSALSHLKRPWAEAPTSSSSSPLTPSSSSPSSTSSSTLPQAPVPTLPPSPSRHGPSRQKPP